MGIIDKLAKSMATRATVIDKTKAAEHTYRFDDRLQGSNRLRIVRRTFCEFLSWMIRKYRCGIVCGPIPSGISMPGRKPSIWRCAHFPTVPERIGSKTCGRATTFIS